MLLLRNGIQPYYIFDGKAPNIKRETIDVRVNNKTKTQIQLNDVNNKNSKEYIKLFKKSYSVSNDQIKDCIELLHYMGINYIEACGEADPYCASLCKNNNIYGVISNDSDLLVFGAKRLLKDFTGKTKVCEITLDNIYKFMQDKANVILSKYNIEKNIVVQHENFVDFSILLGCDYAPHLRGIDSEQLFTEFVLNNMNINDTVDSIKAKFTSVFVPHDYLDKTKEARNYYSLPNFIDINIDNSINSLCMPSKEDIYKLLHDDNLMDQVFVDNFIMELEHLKNAFDNFTKFNNNKFSSFVAYRWNYCKKGDKTKNNKLELDSESNIKKRDYSGLFDKQNGRNGFFCEKKISYNDRDKNSPDNNNMLFVNNKYINNTLNNAKKNINNIAKNNKFALLSCVDI